MPNQNDSNVNSSSTQMSSSSPSIFGDPFQDLRLYTGSHPSQDDLHWYSTFAHSSSALQTRSPPRPREGTERREIPLALGYPLLSDVWHHGPSASSFNSWSGVYTNLSGQPRLMNLSSPYNSPYYLGTDERLDNPVDPISPQSPPATGFSSQYSDSQHSESSIETSQDLFPSDIPSATTSFQSDAMSPATRQRSSTAAEATASHKTGFPSFSNNNKRKRSAIKDDPFASDEEKEHGKRKRRGTIAEDAGVCTVDLTDQEPSSEEKPAEPKEDKRIKMGRFMCAICMDNATNLTVTHCGHCFCANCLHQSLYAETTRHRCPMCRTKVDMRPRQQYSSKTKGFFPLELKLMTKTRKGKQPATKPAS